MQRGDEIRVTWQDAHLVRGKVPVEMLLRHRLELSVTEGVFIANVDGYIVIGRKGEVGSRINEAHFIPNVLVKKVEKVTVEEVTNGPEG